MSNLDEHFITTKQARELSGYTSDYLARLARLNEIVGHKEGNAWVIEKGSLESFMVSQKDRKFNRARELTRMRAIEYRAHIGLKESLKAPFPAPTPITQCAMVIGEASPRWYALSLSVSAAVFVFSIIGAQAFLSSSLPHTVVGVAYEAVRGFEMAFGPIPAQIIAKTEGINEDIYTQSRVRLAARGVSELPLAQVTPTAVIRLFDKGYQAPYQLARHDGLAFSPSTTTAESLKASVAATYELAVKNPSRLYASAAGAYLITGQTAYKGIVNLFSIYRSFVNHSGSVALMLGASIRDVLASIPHQTALVLLAIGNDWAWVTRSAINADISLAYGFATAAPISAQAAFTAINHVGGVLALGAIAFPATARDTYLRMTELPATVAPAIAEVIFNTEYDVAIHFVALGSVMTNGYMAFIKDTGDFAYTIADQANSFAAATTALAPARSVPQKVAHFTSDTLW